MGILRKLGERFRYRLTHSSKLPKGDLVSFFLNIQARGFQPKQIVDVGANCGKWTRKALRVFDSADFLLIEPQIEMSSQLDQLCREKSNVRWINAGVADARGELPFTVVPDTVSSSFTMSKEEAVASGYEQRAVPVVTLDDLAKSETRSVPDIVKIDAEGYEARIMKGATSLVGHTEVFLLELPVIDPPNKDWSSFVELVTLMDQLQYDVYDFTSFQRRPYDGAVGLCEIAFARRNGALRHFGGWASYAAKAA